MARLCYLPATRERLSMWVGDLVTSAFDAIVVSWFCDR